MTSDDAEGVLANAKLRGYLVIDEPFEASSPVHTWLLDEWNTYCETIARNPVMVLRTPFGLWRAAIAFRHGANAELGYIRNELKEAFGRHLGDSARSDDEAWFASTQERRRAEALAYELALIDAAPRDEAFERVFQVHEL